MKKTLKKISIVSVFFLHTISVSMAQIPQPLRDFIDYEQIRINSFNRFYDWFDHASESMYVRGMQYSSSPRGDERFFSFYLEPRRNEEQIDLLGLGITLNFRPNGENTKEWRNVTARTKYKALSYLRSFEMQAIDSVDTKKLFHYGTYLLAMSKGEVGAHIVNAFYSDRFNDNNFKDVSNDTQARVRYALQPLFDKLKSQYGIEIKDYPNEKTLLSGYLQEIEKHTKEHYSEAIYDVLIEGKTEKETQENFSKFFQMAGYSHKRILDRLTPEGGINLSDQIFSLDFDSKVFYRTDNEGKKIKHDEKIALIPKYLTYKYEYGKNGWELVLEFTEFGKKEDYYFLFTDFAKLNPPSFSNNYDPNKDMRYFVVQYDKINKMTISIDKNRVTGHLLYEDTSNYYKFMDKQIPIQK